jgi:recombination protein RecT
MSNELTKTKNEVSASERFMEMVVREASSGGEIKMTDFQKKLSQNYFVKLDTVLKEAERKRMAKTEQYRDVLEFSWKNVNIEKLAVDVLAFSAIGLDPIQKNHINLIPFKNASFGKLDINFMMGFRGMEIKAKKYGFEAPDSVIVKVVYSNEKFTPIWKDNENPIEAYTHKPSENPFDRGEIQGGFYYHLYNSNPEKNKLRVFNMKDIEKRIPPHASVEFWGGEKDVWKNGVKTKEKETIEGWKDEMVYKTICRSAYDDITIDSEKIDDHLVKMMIAEEERFSIPSESDIVKGKIEIKQNAKDLNFDEAEDVTNKPEAKKIESTKEKEVVPSKEVFTDKKLEPIVNGEGKAELNFD